MQLIIDMKTHRLVGSAATDDEANAVCDAQGLSPVHVVPAGGDWDGLTGVDLVKLFNQLPGRERQLVKFETRGEGVKRVNAALAAWLPELPPYGTPGAPAPERPSERAMRLASAEVAALEVRKGPVKKKAAKGNGGPRSGSMASMVVAMTKEGAAVAAIIKAVAKAHPDTTFAKNAESDGARLVQWYQWDARRKGLLPAKAVGKKK